MLPRGVQLVIAICVSKIILELQQFSPAIKIILLESFVLHGKLTNPYFKELSESVYRYAGIVYDLSRSFALPFVPLQNKLTSLAKKTTNAYVSIDGLHPTYAGHELISTELFSVLKAELL